MKKLAAALLLSTALLSPLAAGAQTTPGWNGGEHPTAAQWNSLFGGKVDLGGDVSGNTAAPAGAITANTIANQEARFLAPEDFKLATDPDDTLSFSRYVSYIRLNNIREWRLSPGRTYNVSAPLDLTGFSGQYFNFNGAHIVASGGLYAVIDALGTADSYFSNGNITCGSQSSPCTRGIQIGRYTMPQGYPQDTFLNMQINGFYSQAALFNNGSELFNAISIQAFNSYVAPSCAKATSDSCGYAIIEDGVNHWPLQSSFVTVSLTANTFESFNENRFDKPVMVNFGNGPALWMSGTHRHQYQRGYIQVQGNGVIPAVILFTTPSAGEGDYQHQLDWDVHSEVQPSSIFYVTGNANPAFFGLHMSDHLVQANKLFETDSSVTSVRIYGADLKLTGFLNTTALFDTASKFQIDGDVFMFQESAALWNGPAFSGYIHTNARTNFEAGMTKGAGGFFISDPYGIDQINVPITGPLVAGGGRVVAGSDTGSTNLELDDGSHASSTPYIDFNGHGVTASVRLLTDADGNLTVSSDGTWNIQTRKNLPTLFNYGASTQASLAASAFLSSNGFTYSTLPPPSNYPASALVYCTDCLKPGETPNSGTGIWLYADGHGSWYSTAGLVAAH